jgi:hypothetical protein
MGLMARAARMAGRQGREAISEDDIYAAMENKAMEAFAVGPFDSSMTLHMAACHNTYVYHMPNASFSLLTLASGGCSLRKEFRSCCNQLSPPNTLV